MYGLESSPLSIEAAWEQHSHHSHPQQHPHYSQHRHSQHTLNLNHPAHQRLESSHYQFGYSAAFPQYTIPPISPVSPSTSSVSSQSSSSSSASSAEPTTPLGADYLGRRAFGGFNTHSINGAHAIDLDLDANNCLPTHQLFDFDFAQLAHGSPPSPSLTTSSSTDSHGAALMSPTSPMISVSVPSNTFSADAYDLDAELDGDDDASPPPAPRLTSGKRSATTTSTSTKKARASNSISTKDFVPPDVTGLSKREARLVKNRAAAFLSRQRKREEFELMEIRVAELEQENARLKSLVNDSSSPSSTSSASTASRTSTTPPPSPEIEQLRAQLAAARTRENELAERLERVKYQAQREQAREREELVRLRALVSSSTSIASANKVEERDGVVVVKEEQDREGESDTTSSGASTPAQPMKNLLANPKSGASLGLMVLLCALPSLLSSSTSSTTSSSLPTASSFLDVHPTSAFDASSTHLPTSDSTTALDWEFDWAGRPRARSQSWPSSSSSASAVSHSQASKMDVDNVEGPEKGWTKLEFDANEAALSDLGLGALDISFETRRAEDGSGRVRVRVHSSTSLSSSSSSLSSSSSCASASRRTQQNQVHLTLPTPNQDSEDSDEEGEDLGPFLTSTPSSAFRSSSQSQSMLDGLNLGLGLNSLNNYNGLSHFGMNDLMGVDTMNSLGVGLGMPFGTPDYGLDSATATQAVTQMRRRVRIALARLPHAGGEGGEWDVVEVAA